MLSGSERQCFLLKQQTSAKEVSQEEGDAELSRRLKGGVNLPCEMTHSEKKRVSDPPHPRVIAIRGFGVFPGHCQGFHVFG